MVSAWTVKGTEWNKYVNSEYSALFKDISDDDHEGYEAIYDDILAEYQIIESTGIPANQAHQSATTRMKAARRQFTRLVRLSLI